MKKISIVIPTYNEIENIEEIVAAVISLFQTLLFQYEYEVVVIDNYSTDGTRDCIRALCKRDERIKAILNAKNFGPFNSPYYGLLQGSGDCAILLCADFQDPIELIPDMVKKWEEGHKIVVCQKTSSKENKSMYAIRSLYYKLIKRFSDIEQIEHFTGFGLYDKDFLNVLRDIKDPTPFLRGIVAELGFKIIAIPYEQQRRRAGRSHLSFYSLYDAAMLSFTSYTKIGLRLSLFIGIFVGLMSLITGIVYFVYKLLYWERFAAGMAPVLIGLFFLGGIQLFFLGIVGEYILSINQRVQNHPLVIEEERINFNTDTNKKD